MISLRSSLVLGLLSLTSPLLAQATGGTTPVAPGTGAIAGKPAPGQFLPKPGGGAFFVDPNRLGRGDELVLVEARWGRLVNVHGLDAGGAVDPEPVLRDFLVGETVQSDGSDYVLATSPSTHVQRLIVLRQPGAPAPAPGAGTFEQLVRRAEDETVVVEPEDFAALVSTLPRNAALALRFDDLLEDGASAVASLPEDVRVFVRPPVNGAPATPYPARVVFDASHGGLAQGAFHSTRVLVDFTVSVFEAQESAAPLAINFVGLPLPGPNPLASVLLRLPTRLDFGAGQFTLLRNLAGNELAVAENEPVDRNSPTVDVVRAARAADEAQPNGGFLLDLEPPQVVGRLPVQVTRAVDDPSGDAGYSFLVDWTFLVPCGGRPLPLDALEIAGLTAEVTALGPVPSGGSVQNVRVRLANATAVVAGALVGNAIAVGPLRAGTETSACWFTLLPAAENPPAAGVSPFASFGVHFSEPMRDFDPYDDFHLVEGPFGTSPSATNTVVVEKIHGGDGFGLVPVLPLAHVQGQATPYFIELVSSGARDLAGNPVLVAPAAEIRIKPSAATQTSDGLVLDFDAVDEMPGAGPDLRGQLFYDFANGTILGRPPAFFGAPVDRTNPVPSIMIPYTPGVQTPLVPLGSKLHALWRYCDLGYAVRDETKYNVDVVGLSWAPVGGQVISDFYEQFEISLGHSRFLPDEAIDQNLLPKYPNSGVPGSPSAFADNYLTNGLVVHNRALGYTVDPSDLYLSVTGTVLMPYPLNEGPAPLVTYTWRDTAVTAKGGPSGVGVPLDIEVGAPLFLESQIGALAPGNAVPSIGLPLLMEYRCYPSDAAIGLNALDVSLALNSSAVPAFRAYSSGGINTLGNPVLVLPDQEVAPQGGFNPNSSPPGRRTARSNDNVFSIGQLDLVYRVNRVHSAWFDTGSSTTSYASLLPTLANDPGTGHVSVVLAVRGATGFTGTGGAENDAARLDAYGELLTGSATFLNGSNAWQSSVGSVDGARYIQFRITLVNDLEPLFHPALDTLALAYQQ